MNVKQQWIFLFNRYSSGSYLIHHLQCVPNTFSGNETLWKLKLVHYCISHKMTPWSEVVISVPKDKITRYFKLVSETP